MVQVEQQCVPLRTQAQQADAQQRPGGQVERPQHVFGGQAAGVLHPLCLGQTRQVHHRQFLRGRRVDDLGGLARLGGKGGAQRLMAANDLRDGALQRGHVQRSVHDERGGHVVLRAARLQLVEEPQPLLGERQRHAASPGHGPGGLHRLRPRARLGVDGARELLQRGRLEERAQGQLHLERRADARHHLGGQQRVAAQREEVVVTADLLHPEHLGPERGESLLRLGSGRHVRARRAEGHGIGRGQRLAVHLAIGGQREGVQRNEGGGHHEVRQALPHMLPQRFRVERPALGRHHVGHQSLAATAVFARHHHRALEAGVLPQRGLNLSQLDAEAAHLHLVVDAAQVLQRATGHPAHQVSRAVHACTGLGAEGVGQEALRRQVRPAQVAPGQSRARQVQLAWDTRGLQRQACVEDVAASLRQGQADGGLARAFRHAGEGGVGGVLGGPVEVEDVLHGAGGVQVPHQCARQGLAREVDGAHRARNGAQPQQLGDGRGDGVDERHLAGVGHRRQRQRVAHQEDGAAAREGREQLEDGEVEADGGGRQRARELLAGESTRGPVEERRRAGVGNRHALGSAGGAGGVDDVGEVVRHGLARRSRGGQAREAVRQRVETDGEGLRRVELERVQQGPVGEQQPRPGIGQREVQALARVVRVQGDVGAARLEDGEHRHDELRGALHAHGGTHLGAHAERQQVPGEAVGALLELAIGEALRAGDEGGGVGRASGLLGDARVHQRPPQRGARVARLHHDGVLLGGGKQRQIEHALLGVGDGGLQQDLEVAHEAAHGVLPEEVRAVLHRADQSLGGAGEAERQVEPGAVALELQGVHGEAARRSRGRPRRVLRRGVLEDEHRLEQRRAAQVAPGPQLFDELLEGHVLVRVGAQRRLLHARQQGAEGRVVVQARAQDQGVDEEADEPFQLGEVPAGDGRADDDVVLARVARQQRLEGRQQRHEGRGALLLAERLHRKRERAGQRVEEAGPAEGLHGRTREVRGQLQRMRSPGELLLPPLELLVEHRPLEPGALPHGEVGILHRQLWQRRRPASREGLVERRHLADQHALGPAVRDDVVEVEREHVLGRTELQQLRAQQRTGVQREGAPDFLAHPPQGLGLGGLCVQRAQVHPWEGDGRGRSDDLDRPVLPGQEGGAQRLVTPHQLGQAPFEGLRVQQPLQPDDGGQVVRDVAGLELVDEPQALLGEGQWQRAGAGHGNQRRSLHLRLGLELRPLDALGEGGHGRRLEEGAQGQLHSEGLAHARDDLGGQQRVATQREEVVVTADLLHAQHLGPEGGQPHLGLGDGRLEGAGGGGGLRCWQGPAVHLVVGREGEGVQRHEGPGHHVARQPLLQEVAQGGAVRRGVVTGEVGHQALVAGDVLAHQDERLTHRRVLGKGGLDFTQLDAEAAQLHLEVGAAQEVERAVRQPAHPVSGAVQARAGRGAEDVGHEALGGELGAAQVATGQSDAADEQLPDDSHGHRVQVRVQHVVEGVGDRLANRRALPIRHEAVHGGDDGGLGGAVDVEELAAGGPLRHHLDGAGLATGLEAGDCLQPVGGQHGQDGGRQQHGVDGLAEQRVHQRLAGQQLVTRCQHQGRATQQRRRYLEHGGVEADRGDLQHALAGLYPRGTGHVPGQVEHAAMRHHDALGTPGAARRVDDVREVVGSCPPRWRGVRVPREGRRVGIERQHEGGAGGQRVAQVRVGEEHRRAGVLEHESQALTGVGRVQRDVGATGLEHAEHADDEVERALQAQGNARVGADAEGPQLMGELVGASVQFSVGERQLPEAQGRSVGRAPGLNLERFMDAGGVLEGRGGVVPLHQHLPLLGGAHQRQVGDGAARVGGGFVQQPPQVVHHPPHRRLVEEVGAVLQHAAHLRP